MHRPGTVPFGAVPGAAVCSAQPAIPFYVFMDETEEMIGLKKEA